MAATFADPANWGLPELWKRWRAEGQRLPLPGVSNEDQDSCSGVSDEVGPTLEQLVQLVVERTYGLWPRDSVIEALHSCNNDVDAALQLLYKDIGLSSGVVNEVGVNEELPVQSVMETRDQNMLNKGSSSGVLDEVGPNLGQLVQTVMERSYGIWQRESVIEALKSCNNDADATLELLYKDIGLSSGFVNEVGVNEELPVQSVMETGDQNMLNKGSSSGVSDEVGRNLGQLVQTVMERSYGIWQRESVIEALKSCNNDVDATLELLYKDIGLSSGFVNEVGVNEELPVQSVMETGDQNMLNKHLSLDMGVNEGLPVQSLLETSDLNMLNNACPTSTSDFKAVATGTIESPSSDSKAPTESDKFNDNLQSLLVAGHGEWNMETVFWALLEAGQITGQAIAQLSSAATSSDSVAIGTESTTSPHVYDLNAPPTDSDVFEQTLQNLLEIGFGKWDRATVFRALTAAETTTGALQLLNSEIWMADSTAELNRNKLREERVVVSSLPISCQHHPEPMERVSFKGKTTKLQGCYNPCPMIDVSTSVPATELPQPSPSQVSDIVADKMKVEAASSDRSIPRLQKLKREYTFVVSAEKIAESMSGPEETEGSKHVEEETEGSKHAEEAQDTSDDE